MKEAPQEISVLIGPCDVRPEAQGLWEGFDTSDNSKLLHYLKPAALLLLG